MQPLYASQAGPSQQPPRIQNVSCVFPPTPELGGLYIGNYFGAINVDILKEYGIRAVLTTSVETPVTYHPSEIPFHLKVDAHDKENFSIVDHFQQCLHFIEEHRRLTNVFVHCYAGMSRSASVVIAYLMKKHQWPFQTSLTFLRFKRSIVNPNQGFVVQLKKFESMVNNLRRNQNDTQNDRSRILENKLNKSVAKEQNREAVQVSLQPQPPFQQNTSRQMGFLSPQVSPRSMNGQSQFFAAQRPPSQQPVRVPSQKVLPLYEQQPNGKPEPTMKHTMPLVQPRSQRTRHEQTPIPNFGSNKKKQVAKPIMNYDRLGDESGRKTALSGYEKQMRTSKVAVRPRDLPGYRVG